MRNPLTPRAGWTAAFPLLWLAACSPAASPPADLPTEGVRAVETAAPAASLPTASAAVTPVIPTTSRTPTDSPEPSRTSTPMPAGQEFRYVFPVQPQERTDFAAGGHSYPATDIFAEFGSEFVAVTDGVVDFVSLEDLWDPATDDPAVAGGLCVAIIGDDGVRYYGSHLSAVAAGIRPGVRVEAGRLLGRVGNSGNAVHTPTHLHFGISQPTYPEDWLTRRGELDPYPYLVAWLRGENVTPVFPTSTP
jgi:murein DD-endopeptidase MepM/ murein hydrolase activator NlpD